jgi:hypothetical protein
MVGYEKQRLTSRNYFLQVFCGKIPRDIYEHDLVLEL